MIAIHWFQVSESPCVLCTRDLSLDEPHLQAQQSHTAVGNHIKWHILEWSHFILKDSVGETEKRGYDFERNLGGVYGKVLREKGEGRKDIIILSQNKRKENILLTFGRGIKLIEKNKTVSRKPSHERKFLKMWRNKILNFQNLLQICKVLKRYFNNCKKNASLVHTYNFSVKKERSPMSCGVHHAQVIRTEEFALSSLGATKPITSF